MFDRLLLQLAKTKICSKIRFNKFLDDIPEDYFIDYYTTKKENINSAIIVISILFSILFFIVIVFFDFILSILVSIVVFLAICLYLVRKIRKKYLDKISEVEQFSDLICREMILIYSSTYSLKVVLEYLSKGTYPYISNMLTQMIREMNVGLPPEFLLENFAKKQPSDTIKEFILEIFLPVAKGIIKIDNYVLFESQWRLRKNFDSYLSQLEGKMSIFLAITTIVPITIAMMLVMLGQINLGLLIFLPLIFFVFDLIAVEIFNSGRIKLLGG